MSNPSVKCVKCSYANRTGARFCVRCGADIGLLKSVGDVSAPVALPAWGNMASPVPADSSAITGNGQEFCPQCAQGITPGARFCRHCGQPLPPMLKPTNAESANIALPRTQTAPPPVNTNSTGTPMTLPLNRAADAKAPLAPAPLSDEFAFRGERSSGRRFAFPAWAWVLVGSLFGLFAGIGLMVVRPELMEWGHAQLPASIGAPPTSAPPQVVTPGTTVAPGVVITPTQTNIISATRPAASGAVTSTLTITPTKVTTGTTRSAVP